MTFGISDTSSTLADPWPYTNFPLTFGYAVEHTQRGIFGRTGYREDAPPWRYGSAIGVRIGNRRFFIGWASHLENVTDEVDGSLRMTGGRELLDDPTTIGGWGSGQS